MASKSPESGNGRTGDLDRGIDRVMILGVEELDPGLAEVAVKRILGRVWAARGSKTTQTDTHQPEASPKQNPSPAADSAPNDQISAPHQETPGPHSQGGNAGSIRSGVRVLAGGESVGRNPR